MNVVLVVGRLTNDIVLEKTTMSNTEYVRNCVAVRRERKNASGSYDSDFINIKIFGNTAKFVSDYCKKGSLVSIRGKWYHNVYIDKEGNKRVSDELMVDEINLLESKPREQKPTVEDVYRPYQEQQAPQFDDSDNLPF